MNFTYYYYCDCPSDFSKAVHQLDDEIVLQCTRCFSIEAKKKNLCYHLVCLGCTEIRELGNNATFTEEETCTRCGMTGEVGMDEQSGSLFVLKNNYHSVEACMNGHQHSWKQNHQEGMTCPYCLSVLKEKMSLLWED